MLDKDTIEVCLKAITAQIKPGELSGSGIDKLSHRNGMVQATNILTSLLDETVNQMFDNASLVSNPHRVLTGIPAAPEEQKKPKRRYKKKRAK